MNVLFGTNVVRDVLLEREPNIDAAAKLFALVDHGRIKGWICATTVTTVFYIAAKSFGMRRARDQVRALLDLFEVAAVDQDVLVGALASISTTTRTRCSMRQPAPSLPTPS